MVRKIAPTCALCAVMSLLTGCGAASDTPTAPSSAVVTPPAATTGIVQGVVKHEAYVNHGLFPEGPLSGAQVLVTEGPGAGRSVTTGADGAYRFELPSGPFRIRWSAANYDPRDSDPGEVIAGTTTTVEPVVLRRGGIPEWSISGIVRDGAGNPVADALVDAWDGVAWFVAHASTDVTGGFRIASTREHPDWIHVNAWKEGYVSQSVTAACGPSCAITANPRLLRLVRTWLDGPSTMQVGDVAPISLIAEYDDGSRKAYITRVESSNPAVLQVLPLSQQQYDKSFVKAITPGTAALQDGPILNVHVVP
jgi:Carboxypeptidase regulatory-like domain